MKRPCSSLYFPAPSQVSTTPGSGPLIGCLPGRGSPGSRDDEAPPGQGLKHCEGSTSSSSETAYLAPIQTLSRPSAQSPHPVSKPCPHPSQRPPRSWAPPGPLAAGWVPTCSAARPYALMAAPNGLQATAKIARAALRSDNQ